MNKIINLNRVRQAFVARRDNAVWALVDPHVSLHRALNMQGTRVVMRPMDPERPSPVGYGHIGNYVIVRGEAGSLEMLAEVICDLALGPALLRNRNFLGECPGVYLRPHQPPNHPFVVYLLRHV